MQQRPLEGLRVLEFEGLAPTVFTGMVLADFGAHVTVICKNQKNFIGKDINDSYLNRGKHALVLNLKDKEDLETLKQMVKSADVLIDAYRPGVLESLNLGYKDLEKLNPRIILARVSGYGQTGPMAKLAGHDINYLSMSGFLSKFTNKKDDLPQFPGNILADFGGGGSFGVIGILLALYERQKTGKGQQVDVAMNESVGYLGSFIHNATKEGIWNGPSGTNLLDGGAPFYRVYKCSDGQFMAVGSLEPQFYKQFLKGLGFSGEKYDDLLSKQLDFDSYPQMHEEFEKLFLTKTRDQWTSIFDKLDCCVTPILNLEEIPNHPHWKARNSYLNDQYQRHPKLSNSQDVPNSNISPQRFNQSKQQILSFYNVNKPKL